MKIFKRILTIILIISIIYMLYYIYSRLNENGIKLEPSIFMGSFNSSVINIITLIKILIVQHIRITFIINN